MGSRIVTSGHHETLFVIGLIAMLLFQSQTVHGQTENPEKVKESVDAFYELVRLGKGGSQLEPRRTDNAAAGIAATCEILKTGTSRDKERVLQKLADLSGAGVDLLKKSMEACCNSRGGCTPKTFPQFLENAMNTAGGKVPLEFGILLMVLITCLLF